MSATARYVKPEHADILRDYLSDEGVALIMPEAQEEAKSAGIEDNDYLDDYDFGGEADRMVEVVSDSDHMVFAFKNEE